MDRKALAKLTAAAASTPVKRAAAARVVAELGIGDTVTKAQEGSAMVAWMLPTDLANALAVPGGELPEDLHMTLAYLPPQEIWEYDEVTGEESFVGYRPVDVELVQAAVKIFAEWQWQFEGELSGLARFVSDPDSDVLVALVDSPSLEYVRSSLGEALWEAGLHPSERHGFTPHVTLRYYPKGEHDAIELAQAVPLVVDSVSVVTPDGSRVDYPFHVPGGELEYAVDDPESALDSVTLEGDMGTEGLQGAPTEYVECPHCAATLAKDRLDYCDKCERRVDNHSVKGLSYQVTKADDEMRYTLGPVYAPDRIDAHGEYAEDVELHKAFVEYSLEGERRIKLMHDTSVECGTWVELVRWPYEHELELALPGSDSLTKVKMPAGTIYMGVVWDEAYWPAVKSGKIGGYSLGGRAVRVETSGKGVPTEDMGPQTEPRKGLAPAVDVPGFVPRHEYEAMKIAAEALARDSASRDESWRVRFEKFLDASTAALTHASEQPAPVVNVDVAPPAVTVEAPVVNIHQPDVHVHEGETVVNVPAVKAAEVRVDVHVPEQKVQRTKTITHRDENGLITHTETVPVQDGAEEVQ